MRIGVIKKPPPKPNIPDKKPTTPPKDSNKNILLRALQLADKYSYLHTFQTFPYDMDSKIRNLQFIRQWLYI